jgi:hypothetical protein
MTGASGFWPVLIAGSPSPASSPLAQAVQTPPPDPPSGGRRRFPSRRPSRTRSRAAAAARRDELVPIDNGVDPLLYRLWGLQPLQSQLIKRGELVLEVWARPGHAACARR